MKYYLVNVVALMLTMQSLSVHASNVVISQKDFDGLADYAPAGFGQYFTANGNYIIIAIDLYISASSGGSDATLNLYSFDSSIPDLGSTVLASGVFLESDLDSSPEWIRVEFDTPLSITDGLEYAFVVYANDPGGATGWNNYGSTTSNPYLDGSYISPGFLNSSLNDLAFQIIAIPEPTTLFLSLSVAAALLQKRSVRR